MLPGAGIIQMTGEMLTSPEVSNICESLENSGIRFFSLRDCKVGDKECKRLMKAVGQCKSVLQLNLSLGLVNDSFRVELVAQALTRNRSLRVLSLHGNKLGNEGVKVICQALAQHPHITSLDLGDCAFGDDGLEAVCDLLPPDGAKSGELLQHLKLSMDSSIGKFCYSQEHSIHVMAAICLVVEETGQCPEETPTATCCHKVIAKLLAQLGGASRLQDLTLSANTDITARGWAKFSMAIGANSMLKALYLDYNTLGDYGAGCLAVSLAANRKIEMLDLEGTGLTEHSAKLFLHLVKSYPLRLKRLVLSENRVHKSTVEAIRTCLQDFAENDNDITSEAEETSQSGKVTEVRLRTVDRSSRNDVDKAQLLENLGQLMNTPERKPGKHRNKSSNVGKDDDITRAKYSAEYSSPKISKHPPQESQRRVGEDTQRNPLTETEEWGDELTEVPL